MFSPSTINLMTTRKGKFRFELKLNVGSHTPVGSILLFKLYSHTKQPANVFFPEQQRYQNTGPFMETFLSKVHCNKFIYYNGFFLIFFYSSENINLQTTFVTFNIIITFS